ncbi:hypothetical protein M0R19_07635 [Candidatus Pacearchaeota archaeon]|nr:hypothetical protein [Candidatus Pacearchaeota archaeon]
MDYIKSSREQIRLQMTQLAKEYLQLQNVDFSKTHYLSYLLDIMSIMTANILYFSSLSHHESILITARLDEPIRNLATVIGYNPLNAISAKVDALFQANILNAPLEFRFQMNGLFRESTVSPTGFEESGFRVSSTNNTFQLINKNIIVQRDNSGLIKIMMETPTGTSLLPYDYNAVTGTLSFIVNFDQIETINYEYTVSDDIMPFQFYTIEQPINVNSMLTDVELYVNDTLWEKSLNSIGMEMTDKKYILKVFKDKFIIIFGNGLFGKQPSPGDIIKVRTFMSNGSKGNVITGSVSKKDRIQISDTLSGIMQEVSFNVTNPSIGYGGSDMEENSDIKKNAIASLQSLNRLVSADDFKQLSAITDIPFVDSISYLKRSDLKVNEINTYGVLTFKDGIVPMTSFTIPGI